MNVEMLDRTRRKEGEEKPTISARKACEVWQLSKAVVFTAIENGALWPQSKIQDEPGSKPAFGFHIDYIKEVLKILPKKRGKTNRIFTPDVKARIEKINEKWKKLYPPDSIDRFLINWPK